MSWTAASLVADSRQEVDGATILRCVEQLPGRSGFDDLAVIHHHHFVVLPSYHYFQDHHHLQNINSYPHINITSLVVVLVVALALVLVLVLVSLNPDNV